MYKGYPRDQPRHNPVTTPSQPHRNTVPVRCLQDAREQVAIAGFHESACFASGLGGSIAALCCHEYSSHILVYGVAVASIALRCGGSGRAGCGGWVVPPEGDREHV